MTGHIPKSNPVAVRTDVRGRAAENDKVHKFGECLTARAFPDQYPCCPPDGYDAALQARRLIYDPSPGGYEIVFAWSKYLTLGQESISSGAPIVATTCPIINRTQPDGFRNAESQRRRVRTACIRGDLRPTPANPNGSHIQ